MSADDFATALGGALDRLQTRLGEAHNPTSRFAVRQMEVGAVVELSVDPLGRLYYRFPEGAEESPPACLSRVTLQVTATPPDGGVGVWRKDLFDPSRDVGEVPGVDPGLRDRLGELDVGTVGELMEVAGRARAKVALAALLRVDRDRVGRWAGRAGLLALRGIDRLEVQLLERLGVRSLGNLAAATTEELVAAYNGTAGRPPFGELPPLEPKRARCWVEAAASFVGSRRESARQGGTVAYFAEGATPQQEGNDTT